LAVGDEQVIEEENEGLEEQAVVHLQQLVVVDNVSAAVDCYSHVKNQQLRLLLQTQTLLILFLIVSLDFVKLMQILLVVVAAVEQKMEVMLQQPHLHLAKACLHKSFWAMVRAHK